MRVEIEGRCVEFDRPQKWVWFDKKLTILDLATYYTAVSPWLLPYLERRPVVFETYKGTIHGPNSFEQDPPQQTPRWIKTVRIPGHERTVTYVLVDCAATLVYLVSIFMVTLHVWESTTKQIEKPDFLLLDLDPGDACTLAQLAGAALRARDALAEHGLRDALVKTSGARGLHVFVPLVPEHDYPAVRSFTHAVAHELALRAPRQITAERDPKRRKLDQIYVDWGQMGRGMTIAPPFVPRACDGAPVSMPLAWSEIEAFARSRSKQPPIESFKRYHVGNAVQILKQNGDAWQWRPQRLRL